MTSYESKIKTLHHSQEVIYKTLSDLSNLSLIQNRIPQDKIKDMSFDTDSVTATVDKIGEISLRIIDRDPYKTIKLTVAGAPADAFMWIQLKEVSENNTKLKLTIKTKLNKVMKMMLKGKIEKFIDGFADNLAGLDYSRF